MIYIWLSAFIAFLIIEFVTYDMVTIWFSAGALCSMLLSCFWDNLFAQIILFIAISALTMLLFRSKAIKYLNRNKFSTNVDSLVGTKIKLIKGADPMNYGEAKLHNGVVWSVITKNEVIDDGEFAEIIAIEGNKLIVKKINQEDINL